MSWKVRHEGSPRSIDGLELSQVVEGLQDGLWEPTDEVMGPQDRSWQAIENHPQLAEAAADIEPPPGKPYDDETRLDMNALIDVCLVLLIFMILTTSYAALERYLQAPDLTADAERGPLQVTEQKVKELMVRVQVVMEEGQPVIRVEDEVVPRDQLVAALARYANAPRSQRKTELLLEHDEKVPYGAIIAIQDAAKGAGMQEVHDLIPRDRLLRKKLEY